jgi:outer membrane protein OmpA-like peptidoglycan-associated protein
MPTKRFLIALAAAGFLAGCSSGGQLRLSQAPGAWHLPPDEVAEIGKGRADLTSRLGNGFRDVAPEIAARALARLGCLSPVPENYILYFGFDKSELNSHARLVIQRVVADARKLREGDAWPHIWVTGHTDLAGSADYNLKLSLRRADAGRAALIEAGIPAANIMIAGRGESDPAVPSPDGVAEAKDRRAVIIIQ